MLKPSEIRKLYAQKLVDRNNNLVKRAEESLEMHKDKINYAIDFFNKYDFYSVLVEEAVNKSLDSLLLKGEDSTYVEKLSTSIVIHFYKLYEEFGYEMDKYSNAQLLALVKNKLDTLGYYDISSEGSTISFSVCMKLDPQPEERHVEADTRALLTQASTLSTKYLQLQVSSYYLNG